jgi:hypothetical protein
MHETANDLGHKRPGGNTRSILGAGRRDTFMAMLANSAPRQTAWPMWPRQLDAELWDELRHHAVAPAVRHQDLVLRRSIVCRPVPHRLGAVVILAGIRRTSTFTFVKRPVQRAHDVGALRGLCGVADGKAPRTTE